MRKSVIGLMVVALLLFAGQAGAQSNGTGDMLGLIASGAVQPFWALGGNIAIIEITSPVDHNFDLHSIFFNASCERDFSIPLPVSRNGVLIFSPNDLGVNYSGLLVIAGTDNQVTLRPATAPFHVRGLWVNLGADWFREIDPVSIQHAESVVPQTWNALRSSASFGSILVDAFFQTEIFLNCPSPALLATVPTSAGFPAAPAIAYSPTKAGARIFGVIFDEDEVPLRNITIACNCNSMFPLLTISSVYGDPNASTLFYTEFYTYTGPGVPLFPPGPATFTGYRSITVTSPLWPGGSADDFSRLNNGSSSRYLDLPPFNVQGLR